MINDINSPVLNSLCFNKKDLINRHVKTIFDSSRQFDFDKIKTAVEDLGTIANNEQKILTKNKNIIPVSCSFSLIKNQQKNDNYILLIARDVSMLKKTEDDLKLRNKELNSFIYRASHDLKGPLASMMGLLNLIDIDENDITSAKNYIKLIRASALKLNGVVSELLDLGRITATEFQYEQISVADHVEGIISDLKFLPEFNDIKITVDNRQKKSFLSEPRILKSILQNLIENSIKYRRKNTESFIKIKITDSAEGINIQLEDNGKGIEEEIQSKVFNMFFRGNVESSGSGLGLYIVKTGLEKIHGNVRLTSTPKQGSTFYLSIPNIENNKPGKSSGNDS